MSGHKNTDLFKANILIKDIHSHISEHRSNHLMVANTHALSKMKRKKSNQQVNCFMYFLHLSSLKYPFKKLTFVLKYKFIFTSDIDL